MRVYVSVGCVSSARCLPHGVWISDSATKIKWVSIFGIFKPQACAHVCG